MKPEGKVISASETVPQNGLKYSDAGVDIDAGIDLVNAIVPLADSTMRPGVSSDLGGFGAIFDLKAAGFRDPVLVAATDGVGTKLLVAKTVGNHDTVGIDLVAMCANDLVVQGAEPMFFLDYFATGKLGVDEAASVVKGIAEGCLQAGCALIGGETAEMPGLYRPGDYDLAGFCVGAVERDGVLTGRNVKEGDVVLGLASNGVHANGFSLIRKIVDMSSLDYADAAPFGDQGTLGDELLKPTRIYVKSCLEAIGTGGVRALAHITGGGLIENIPRVFANWLAVEIDSAAWEVPPVFKWLAETGGVDADEMARTFNCGIGMVVIVETNRAPEVSRVLSECGETVLDLGRVVGREGKQPSVKIQSFEERWKD